MFLELFEFASKLRIQVGIHTGLWFRNPANQFDMVNIKYPINYRGFIHVGWFAGFLPSTVGNWNVTTDSLWN